MTAPSFMIAAGQSGVGKTTVTCGLLQILKNRGFRTAAFKCGPDYIDPMFHTRVLGAKSRNLDTFLMGTAGVARSFEKNSAGCDAAVLEGAMGYYDGLGGVSCKASAYDVARTVDTGVILLVGAKGASLSLLAHIQGFLQYRPDSRIRGVILNRLSPGLYGRMKEQIEKELHIQVYGYVPKLEDCFLESRHLGLIMPEEIPQLRRQMEALGEKLEETLDVDKILKDFAIVKRQPGGAAPDALLKGKDETCRGESRPVRIALAKDEAFCFFYEDNLELLRELGAEPVEFSPLHDEGLPPDIRGLLLYGGYPELHGEALSKNKGMRTSIREALKNGLPCMAECGGFMYLQEELEDMAGQTWPMVGFLPGRSYKTPRLTRFGYIELENGKVFGRETDRIPAHEFHYFDSDNCGRGLDAQKPLSERNWKCMVSTENLLLGYPHLHYYGNPQVAKDFLRAARKHGQEQAAADENGKDE